MAIEHPFDLLVQERDESQIRLAEAALFLAMDHCRHLKVGSYLHRLDAFALRVDRFNARSSCDRIEALRTVLVQEEQFVGNMDNYYDPRNSLLNQVLDRRVGIPIALSAVWLDVAWQLDWPFVGVGLPGHYIIKFVSCQEETLIDPFRGGRRLARADCEKFVAVAYGRRLKVGDEYFQPASVHQTLTRMLNNLRAVFVQRQSWYNLVCVLQRLLVLHPDADEVRHDLNLAHGHLARLN